MTMKETDMIDMIGDEDYCDTCGKVHQEDEVRMCDPAAVTEELEAAVRALRLEDTLVRRLLLMAQAQQKLGRLAQLAAVDVLAAEMAADRR